MTRKCRWILLFAAVLMLFTVLFGCDPKEPEEPSEDPEEKVEVPMGEPGTRSVYLYMCGSNLETKAGAAGKNLDEILASEIPDNVNFIVETGGAARWRSHDIPNDKLCRYLIKGGEMELLESLPNANMGSGDTFYDFVSYGVENYPAEKMCVIVWDHGGGSLNGVANDENYGFEALTLTEMETALGTLSEKMTDRFEIFGFDACLMANYETAEMLAPYARYLLASEEIEPSGGWDYNALIEALKSSDSSGKEIGQAVCDGYFEKCETSGKDSTATLSVTDLGSFGKLQTAFDDLASEMKTMVEQEKGILMIAQSANAAQKYGGASEGEGYSNLVDLKHFAENYTYSEKSAVLVEAVEEAVEYFVCGSKKSYAGGLSFYYPYHYDENQIKSYSRSICPSEAYAGYLDSVYDNIPETTVVFDDPGSVQEDGSFGIRISEESANYVLSVDFDLVEFAMYGMSDGNVLLQCSRLGRDNDIIGRLSDCHSNFRGVWITLNGCKLFVTPVEISPEYIIYTAPIELNGTLTNLRFAFVWDDSYDNGGYYKILGAWNGVDTTTGMSDKELTIIKPTDEIKAYYPYREFTITDAGWREEEATMREQTVPKGEGYVVEEEPMDKPVYFYQFVITDIFGREYFSDVACMKMTKTYDELKEHPLSDGEYAADVDEVLKAAGTSVIDVLGKLADF